MADDDRHGPAIELTNLTKRIGKASFHTSLLAAGTRNVHVVYIGDICTQNVSAVSCFSRPGFDQPGLKR